MNTLDLKAPIDSLMAGIEKATEDAFVASLTKLGLPITCGYDILKYAPQIELTGNDEFGMSYYYLGRGKREFLFTSRWTTPSMAEFSLTGKCTSSFEISFEEPTQ